MKNIIKLSLISAMALTQLNAGILGINAGLGGGMLQNKSIDGTVTDNSNSLVNLTKQLNLEGNSDNYYMYAYFEHPIPLIPNIKIEMAQEAYSGQNNLNISLFGKNFNNKVDSTLDLSSMDGIMYWGVPMTGILSSLTPIVDYDLDFGFGVKKFTGFVNLQDDTGIVSVQKDFQNTIIPYAYLRARAEAFGIGVEGTGKYISYNTNEFSEYSIKLDYTIPLTPILDFGVEAGYKTTTLIADTDYFKTNINSDNIFFGGFIKF